MSSDLLSRHEPRGSAGPAAPYRPGPGGKPSSPHPATRLSRLHRSRPALIMAGVATVALVSGAGVANAATDSGGVLQSSPPVAGMPSPSPGMGWYGHGGVMPLHGQIVVAKRSGGFQTVDFQGGTVAKVDSASITLKSPDGFTQSYPITGSTIVSANRDGIGSVKAGNEVVVIATVSGHTATAARIVDVTQLKAGHQMFGFGPGAHP